MSTWPLDVLKYCGMVTHVHTVVPEERKGGCAGEQTIEQVWRLAHELGIEGVAFTQHASNPASPEPVSPDSSLMTELIGFRNEIIAARADSPVRLWPGLEVSILPSGELDLQPAAQTGMSYVIASQHGGLGAPEKNPRAIADRLMAAARNPMVDAIGHPTRSNDDVLDTDWPRILAIMAETNTAPELNFNLWYTYGPGKREGVETAEAARQTQHWRRWLRMVAESGAPVVTGLDIHNAGMWPQDNPAESWSPTIEALRRFLGLVQEAGIGLDRLINRTPETFDRWLTTPKAQRRSLM